MLLPADLGRYALILSDTPVARRLPALKFQPKSVVQDSRQRIQAAQATLREELASRNIRVTGSVQLLLNAVFVEATRSQETELRALPDVRRVVFMPRIHLNLDRAIQLVNAPGAWNTLGGEQNAGKGVKIAIIDTGIDKTHPAFQDTLLQAPTGYPICDQPAPNVNDCAFTNNKVIVARSYVGVLAAGYGSNPAANSRPDDYSARDRVGHGTAVAMVAAGETNTGPSDTITGMAPKAFLGSYKVFGSPGVIDYSSGDAIIMALEDALQDGMDIAVLSLGAPALSGPLDQGTACGALPSSPCDPEAVAVENAVQAGMTVVTAAGNEGDYGIQLPTLGTIDSPGTAPSAITVGATTNSHVWENAVRIPGGGVPSNLQVIPSMFGDGPIPSAPLTAPMRDVSKIGPDALGCSALPAGSLTGTIALIERGICTFALKVSVAEAAGAVGVILYQPTSDTPIPPGGLGTTTIPAVMIGASDAQALLSFLASNPDHAATIDPNVAPVDVSTFDQVAEFSSRGPATGTNAIKPELGAVGTDMYMATQRYDSNGAMYSADGYTVQSGTSFAGPLVAGAVALVKQKNPSYTTDQLKSAVVNTANQSITDTNGPASITAVGAGKLDAGAAVNSTITVSPSTLSFGVIGNALPSPQQLLITNQGTTAVNLSLSINPTNVDPNRTLTASQSALTLQPNQSMFVTFTLAGSTLGPGSYEGNVVIQGGPTPIHVPFLYLKGDGVPYNIFALTGDGFDCTVNQSIPDGAIYFRVIDQYGVPVTGLPVQFQVTAGGGSINTPDPVTDVYGLAGAGAVCGPNPVTQQFSATAGGLTVTFTGTNRLVPTIAANGAVNAASFDVGQGLAPGSYISLFGTALAESIGVADSATLPLALDDVSVSFDIPDAGISVPGRLYYVSPGQINVQIPWELQGHQSALMKVDIQDTSGALYTLPLSQFSPGIFSYYDFNGNPNAAALDENNNLVTSANPVLHGHVVQLFANGLGPVSNQPATGAPVPDTPYSQCLTTPTFTIGGQQVTPNFSGLAPGYSGLYQVNVQVPSDLTPGVYPITISIGGITSKPTNLAVQ